MYHVSAQGVDESAINVHYYYYYTLHTQVMFADRASLPCLWIPAIPSRVLQYIPCSCMPEIWTTNQPTSACYHQVPTLSLPAPSCRVRCTWRGHDAATLVAYRFLSWPPSQAPPFCCLEALRSGRNLVVMSWKSHGGLTRKRTPVGSMSEDTLSQINWLNNFNYMQWWDKSATGEEFWKWIVSVQFKTVSLRSEKPLCAPPCLSEVSSTSFLVVKLYFCFKDVMKVIDWNEWTYTEKHSLRLYTARIKMLMSHVLDEWLSKGHRHTSTSKVFILARNVYNTYTTHIPITVLRRRRRRVSK